MCVCFFDPMEGGLTIASNTLTVSTWFTRLFLKSVCNDSNGKPCHTVIINYYYYYYEMKYLNNKFVLKLIFS